MYTAFVHLTGYSFVCCIVYLYNLVKFNSTEYTKI